MSKRILTYNGINLSTFGAHVSGEGVWAKPAPEFERISVPGRSGDVLLYNGRYSNVDITYRFGITENFDTNYTSLIAALLGSPGYHKLVDSKHPGVYRMAAIEKVIEPTMTQQLSVGEFDVTFNCKPQVYLDSGDEPSTWNSTTYMTNYLTNPTGFTAKPLIKITTKSTLPDYFFVRFSVSGASIDGYPGFSLTASDTDTITNPIIYDPETSDAYDSSGKSLNDRAREQSTIIIPARASMVGIVPSTYQSVVSKVEIIPRWWRL